MLWLCFLCLCFYYCFEKISLNILLPCMFFCSAFYDIMFTSPLTITITKCVCAIEFTVSFLPKGTNFYHFICSSKSPFPSPILSRFRFLPSNRFVSSSKYILWLYGSNKYRRLFFFDAIQLMPNKNWNQKSISSNCICLFVFFSPICNC